MSAVLEQSMSDLQVPPPGVDGGLAAAGAGATTGGTGAGAGAATGAAGGGGGKGITADVPSATKNPSSSSVPRVASAFWVKNKLEAKNNILIE